MPFSIIGTFAVMYLLGYSLNNLSLMALTLSVGFVVDDAIVMLENIVRHMEMGESRMEAALLASREIGFTILSMTISLVAVFIPVLFMGGIVGRLLHEFSVTIVVAILISGFVSLSLHADAGQPLPEDATMRARHGLLYRALEGGFNVLARWYEPTLRIALRFRFGHAVRRGAHAGGHRLPVQDHAHGLHSQPGQRTSSSASRMGRQDISFESMAAAPYARRRDRRGAIRTSTTWASFLHGRQPGRSSSPSMKPRNERALSVDQIIEELRPKLLAVPGILRVHAESAAHHRQRPVRHQRLPAHAAEHQPEGPVHLGAALCRPRCADCPVSWTSTPTCRSPARN